MARTRPITSPARPAERAGGSKSATWAGSLMIGSTHSRPSLVTAGGQPRAIASMQGTEPATLCEAAGVQSHAGMAFRRSLPVTALLAE